MEERNDNGRVTGPVETLVLTTRSEIYVLFSCGLALIDVFEINFQKPILDEDDVNQIPWGERQRAARERPWDEAERQEDTDDSKPVRTFSQMFVSPHVRPSAQEGCPPYMTR